MAAQSNQHAQVVIVQALVGGASVKAAVQLVGIHRATFYRWQQHDPTLRAAVEAAYQQYFDACLVAAQARWRAEQQRRAAKQRRHSAYYRP